MSCYEPLQNLHQKDNQTPHEVSKSLKHRRIGVLALQPEQNPDDTA